MVKIIGILIKFEKTQLTCSRKSDTKKEQTKAKPQETLEFKLAKALTIVTLKPKLEIQE